MSKEKLTKYEIIHLCEVVEEGVGSLLTELPLGQGQETGLLLDHIAEI